jgi:hypothetical protein
MIALDCSNYTKQKVSNTLGSTSNGKLPYIETIHDVVCLCDLSDYWKLSIFRLMQRYPRGSLHTNCPRIARTNNQSPDCPPQTGTNSTFRGKEGYLLNSKCPSYSFLAETKLKTSVSQARVIAAMPRNWSGSLRTVSCTAKLVASRSVFLVCDALTSHHCLLHPFCWVKIYIDDNVRTVSAYSSEWFLNTASWTAASLSHQWQKHRLRLYKHCPAFRGCFVLTVQLLTSFNSWKFFPYQIAPEHLDGVHRSLL